MHVATFLNKIDDTHKGLFDICHSSAQLGSLDKVLTVFCSQII